MRLSKRAHEVSPQHGPEEKTNQTRKGPNVLKTRTRNKYILPIELLPPQCDFLQLLRFLGPRL